MGANALKKKTAVAKSRSLYFLEKRGSLVKIKARKSRKRLEASKLAYLTERLGGVIQVADAVQADKSRVSRWAKGARPDEKNYQAISALEFVLERLSRFLNDKSANKWMESSNAFLGGARPIDRIHQDRVVEVLSAANQEEAGSYA